MDPSVETARPTIDLADLQILQAVQRRLFAARPEPIRIGRYELQAPLGHGAMGTVWRALDPSLERTVAVKLLRTSTAFDVDRARRWTRSEASALATLSHPNVVHVFDTGTYTLDETARLQEQVPATGHYIAMEWVDGPTLASWLLDPRSTAEIIAVFLDAGRGLQAAHAQGLVHRDFKPDNVLVAIGPVAKVVDFGLARLRDATAADGVVGTPWTMAPEQLEGREVDARADQFAFCLCLWEALLGPAASTLDALEQRKRNGPWQAPRGDVSPRLRAALARGLSPRAEDRYPSMDALLRAIRGDPRPRRRLALALGLAALGSLGVAVWPRTPAPTAPPAEAADTDALGVVEAVAAGTIETLAPQCQAESTPNTPPGRRAWALACLGAIANRQGDCHRARRRHAEAFELARADGADQAAAFSAARSAIASSGCDDPDAMARWLRHAEAALQRTTSADPLLRAEVGLANASLLVRRAREKDALPMYRAVVRLRTEALGEHHSAVAKARMLVGNSLQRLRRADEASSVQIEAIAQLEAAVGSEHLDVATALNDHATTLLMLERPSEAADALRRGLAITEHLGLQEHPSAAMLHHNLGMALTRMHRYVEALPHQRDAARRREALHGSLHVKTLKSLNNLGLTLIELGRLGEASDVLYDALARHESIGPHPAQRQVLANLVRLAQLRGEHEAADEHRARRRALDAALSDRP